MLLCSKWLIQRTDGISSLHTLSSRRLTSHCGQALWGALRGLVKSLLNFRKTTKPGQNRWDPSGLHFQTCRKRLCGPDWGSQVLLMLSQVGNGKTQKNLTNQMKELFLSHTHMYTSEALSCLSGGKKTRVVGGSTRLGPADFLIELWRTEQHINEPLRVCCGIRGIRGTNKSPERDRRSRGDSGSMRAPNGGLLLVRLVAQGWQIRRPLNCRPRVSYQLRAQTFANLSLTTSCGDFFERSRCRGTAPSRRHSSPHLVKI